MKTTKPKENFDIILEVPIESKARNKSKENEQKEKKIVEKKKNVKKVKQNVQKAVIPQRITRNTEKKEETLDINRSNQLSKDHSRPVKKIKK